MLKRITATTNKVAAISTEGPTDPSIDRRDWQLTDVEEAKRELDKDYPTWKKCMLTIWNYGYNYC